MGYLTGSMFLNNANASVFLTPLVSIPLFAFVKRIKSLPFVFPIFNYVNYVSYAGSSYSGAIVALYGYQRCGTTLQSVFTNFTQQLRWYLEDSFGVQVEELNQLDLLQPDHQQLNGALMLPIIPKWKLVEDDHTILCGDVAAKDSPCVASNGFFDSRLLVSLVQFASNLTQGIVKQAETIAFNGTSTVPSVWTDALNTMTTHDETTIWQDPFDKLVNQTLMRHERNAVEFEWIGSNQTDNWTGPPISKATTGITAKFIDALMKLINGQFIDKRDGQVKSFALIDMGYEDDGAWFYIVSLLGLMIGFRFVSFFFVFLHTKNK